MMSYVNCAKFNFANVMTACAHIFFLAHGINLKRISSMLKLKYYGYNMGH